MISYSKERMYKSKSKAAEKNPRAMASQQIHVK
jgi:hypothetical protein